MRASRSRIVSMNSIACSALIRCRPGATAWGPCNPKRQRGEYIRRLKSSFPDEFDILLGLSGLENGHQHGGIEERFHSPVPKFALSRPSRIVCNTSSVEDAERGCPARNTQTPCSLVSGAVPRTGRSVICSPVLSISRESPGSRCSFSLRSLGISTRPALAITRRVRIWFQYVGGPTSELIVTPGGSCLPADSGPPSTDFPDRPPAEHSPKRQRGEYIKRSRLHRRDRRDRRPLSQFPPDSSGGFIENATVFVRRV